jgi:hypothetical protein
MHGEAKEVEDAKKFKAFKGSGNLLLSPDQLKKASSSQVPPLASGRIQPHTVVASGLKQPTYSSRRISSRRPRLPPPLLKLMCV